MKILIVEDETAASENLIQMLRTMEPSAEILAVLVSVSQTVKWLDSHPSPDLIMMDGGKGQVGIAQKVLDRLELPIPVCGMVKDDRHKTRGLYYNGREVPIQKDTEAFRLITRIQEEAHRFAIGYHRSLRSKEQVHSVLDDIPGIGQSRRRALMKTFVTLDAIRSADVETLAAVPAMNRASAKAVYTFFHPEKDPG